MRDYEHGRVKASANRGGVNVHIPQGQLLELPNGEHLVELLEQHGHLLVARSPSRSRDNVHLAFHEPESEGDA